MYWGQKWKVTYFTSCKQILHDQNDIPVLLDVCNKNVNEKRMCNDYEFTVQLGFG